MSSKNNGILLPDGAIKYILYQRTELQSLFASFISRIFSKLKLPLNGLVLDLEKKIRSQSITDCYIASIEIEFESIKCFLPRKLGKMVDIGCGVSALDVFIYKYYQDLCTDFFLVDKTAVEGNVFYGFKEKSAFYNSMSISKEMLCLNGVPRNNIHLVDVAAEPLPHIGDVDLIISLISWGFHYPVEVYIDFAQANLKEEGCLILDIRKGTDGIKILKEKFVSVETILEKEKFQRVLVRR